jgi:hypothetical protein
MPAKTPIAGDKDQNSGFIIAIVPRIRVANIYDAIVDDGSMTRFKESARYLDIKSFTMMASST